MIAILLTFLVVTAAMMLVHRALGQPETDLVAAMKVSGGITLALIGLSKSPEAINELLPLLTTLLDSGPSG